jgi:signal transduction histidine kinase
LRAPLATITGFLELVQEGMVAKLSDRGEKLALVADRNATFMMRLIADLLDIEKARAGMLKIKKEKFPFSQLLDEMDGSLKEWAAELGVKLVLTPAAITLNGDRDMLKRVLFNLLSNAIKYSPRGSSVTLAAQQEGRLVQISVSDEGPGIAPDEQASIFDRFVQLGSSPDSDPESGSGSADRQKKGGSGLGLAICKAIVELHGGRIWVHSRLGQGSTFCFTLPL